MLFRLRASPARLALSSLNIKAEETSCYNVRGPSSKVLLLSHWRRGGSAGLRALVLPAGVIDWAAAALEEDPFCRSDLKREEGRAEGFPSLFSLFFPRKQRAWAGGKAQLCWDCWIFTDSRFSSTTGMFLGTFGIPFSWEPFGSWIGSPCKALPDTPGFLSLSVRAP